MVKYRLSRRATEDLALIYDYTYEKFGEARADEYLQQIENSILDICLLPEIALNASDIRKGYFKYPTQKHMLYFTYHEKAMLIIRVLHQQMHYLQHLKPDW